jgi:adenine phosphoribosyltransferase
MNSTQNILNYVESVIGNFFRIESLQYHCPVMEMTDEFTKEVTAAILPVPFKGIECFFDISGILAQPLLFRRTIEKLVEVARAFRPDYICALDARGFLLASPVCLDLLIPLVMIRKQGKLPGLCHGTIFDKEYESGDVFEIQDDVIRPKSRILLIDDVLATGGSLRAAHSLVKHFDPVAVEGLCLVDLGLESSKSLAAHGLHVTSLFHAASWARDV